MSVLCIDKRNGRTAYKAEFSDNAGLLDITGDAEKKTVDLVMQRDTVQLTFTDKPLPPPSAKRRQARRAAHVELDQEHVRPAVGRVRSRRGMSRDRGFGTRGLGNLRCENRGYEYEGQHP